MRTFEWCENSRTHRLLSNRRLGCVVLCLLTTVAGACSDDDELDNEPTTPADGAANGPVGDAGDAGEDAGEFDEAQLFFELNDTDGDLGIHALVDGEAWSRVTIRNSDGERVFAAEATAQMRDQGLTEFAFESEEPSFDELEPEEFFDRFPEGTYTFEATTLENTPLSSEAELRHVMPAAAAFTVNGEDAVPASPEAKEACEEADELPTLNNPVVIQLDAVTGSHPDLGADGDVNVIRYRFVAEYEDEEENVFVSYVDLQPTDAESFSVTFPEEFFVDGAEVKFEVLARDESFNQTASESCPFEFVAQ